MIVARCQNTTRRLEIVCNLSCFPIRDFQVLDRLIGDRAGLSQRHSRSSRGPLHWSRLLIEVANGLLNCLGIGFSSGVSIDGHSFQWPYNAVRSGVVDSLASGSSPLSVTVLTPFHPC